jgi:hypothetical protein
MHLHPQVMGQAGPHAATNTPSGLSRFSTLIENNIRVFRMAVLE